MKTSFSTDGAMAFFPTEVTVDVVAAIAVLNVIVVVFLAYAIHIDAADRRLRGEWVFLSNPWLWLFIVLAANYPAALAYWLIHYSTLRSGGDKKQV